MRTAMMAITTNNSMSVNAGRDSRRMADLLGWGETPEAAFPGGVGLAGGFAFETKSQYLSNHDRVRQFSRQDERGKEDRIRATCVMTAFCVRWDYFYCVG